jgi:[acyl-carrier-protein] S-malonyltransferase
MKSSSRRLVTLFVGGVSLTIAFVFPGQGAQFVGMGRDLYAESSAAQMVFAQADATLGFSLTSLCFDGPEDELTATENAQPALLTISTALLAALADSVDVAVFSAKMAAFVAGHSLGEYSALVASGALDFPTALQLVRRRGEFMAAADEGVMAAIIGMDEAPLEALCNQAAQGEALVIANYNSPGQLVISGSAAAVERASALAKAHGAKRALPLKVSAAFHSPLMRAAAEGMSQPVDTAAISDARVPVISNVQATPLIEADAIRRELIAQITAPVHWIASVRYMAEMGVDTFVEIGPGAVLTGLIKRIVPGARLINISDLASVRSFLSS